MDVNEFLTTKFMISNYENKLQIETGLGLLILLFAYTNKKPLIISLFLTITTVAII